jgi:hypothetical protein
MRPKHSFFDRIRNCCSFVCSRLGLSQENAVNPRYALACVEALAALLWVDKRSTRWAGAARTKHKKQNISIYRATGSLVTLVKLRQQLARCITRLRHAAQ